MPSKEKNEQRIQSLIAQISTHPAMRDHIERSQSVLNDFVSQFDLGYARHPQSSPGLSLEVCYEPEFLRNLAKDVINEHRTLNDYLAIYPLGMPIDITIKGKGAGQCAHLLQDALHESGIEYSEKILLENGGASLGCRLHSDEIGQQLDLLHDFAQANFDNGDLLHAVFEAERKIAAIARKKRGIAASRTIEKVYSRSIGGKPLLNVTYETNDEALLSAAKHMGAEVTVVQIEEGKHKTQAVVMQLSDPAKQQDQCEKVMAAIVASVERAPLKSELQRKEPGEPSAPPLTSAAETVVEQRKKRNANAKDR